MKRRQRRFDPRYLLVGGSTLAALGLLIDAHQLSAPKSGRSPCQEIVQPQSVLSREELAQLLMVAERSPKTTVRQIMAEPYCQLSEIEVRSGIKAEREAYPLAFDPKTWLIVLYEGDEYAGYAFQINP